MNSAVISVLRRRSAKSDLLLGGVGAQQPLFWGRWVPTPYLASEPNCPNYKQLKNNNKQRGKMKTTNLITSTHEVLKRLPTLITITALAGQTILTGCASINQKEESIDAILAKQNVLIEKVKIERAQPEVSEKVSTDESLKKAEMHLLLSLDEIVKANETIKTRIINENRKDENYGQNEGHGN
jgi:hypothetical protein